MITVKICYEYVNIFVKLRDMKMLNSIRYSLDNPNKLIRNPFVTTSIQVEYDEDMDFEIYGDIYDKSYTLENTDTNETSDHKTIYDALKTAISKSAIKFQPNKTYRFDYEGGTRSGQRRAVLVNKVTKTTIGCNDLDTGNFKNYSLNKISNIEKFELPK